MELDARYKRAVWWAVLTQVFAFALGFLVFRLPFFLYKVLDLSPGGRVGWNQWPAYSGTFLAIACISCLPFWISVLFVIGRNPREATKNGLVLVQHGYWIAFALVTLAAVVYILW